MHTVQYNTRTNGFYNFVLISFKKIKHKILAGSFEITYVCENPPSNPLLRP